MAVIPRECAPNQSSSRAQNSAGDHPIILIGLAGATCRHEEWIRGIYGVSELCLRGNERDRIFIGAPLAAGPPRFRTAPAAVRISVPMRACRVRPDGFPRRARFPGPRA
jgi:hypothetical protein